MGSLRVLLVCLLGLLLGGAFVPVRADTVEMKNGLKMEGKVQQETSEFIILLVYNDTGRVRIPREQIKSIEYDFDSKVAALKEDDFKGQFELGIWAFHKGKYKEALQQFEKVRGKEGVGQDLLKWLAQAYDKNGDLEKALESYKDYLKFAPQDQESKLRQDELIKELGLDKVQQPVAVEKPKITDGLESMFQWSPENWGNKNKVTPYVDPDGGNKMFLVQGLASDPNAPEDKRKTVFSGIGASPLDLSKSSEILFKAYHNSKNVLRIAVAFTNQRGEFYEGKQFPLPPNTWVKKAIPVDKNDFKSKETNWEHTSKLGGREHINKVIFFVYTSEEFTLYVDHIFFR